MSADYLFTTEAGISWSIDFDQSGDVTIHSSQDVEPILDANAQIANHFDPTFSKVFEGPEYRLVRRIPFNLITKWENEEGINFWDEDAAKKVMTKLNSSEYYKLRTWEGTI